MVYDMLRRDIFRVYTKAYMSPCITGSYPKNTPNNHGFCCHSVAVLRLWILIGIFGWIFFTPIFFGGRWIQFDLLMIRHWIEQFAWMEHKWNMICKNVIMIAFRYLDVPGSW